MDRPRCSPARSSRCASSAKKPHAERRLPPQGLPDQRADLRVRRGADGVIGDLVLCCPVVEKEAHRASRSRPVRAPAGARRAARAGLRPRDERRGRGRNGSARSRHPREAGLSEPVPVSPSHDAQRRDAPARLPAVDRRRAPADGRAAASLAHTMRDWDGQQDLWLFGYGSLIWNPGCRPSPRCAARCTAITADLWSRVNRGTPERPGLVLALDRGGSCSGIAFRLAGPTAQPHLETLWKREMPMSRTGPRGCRARWKAANA